MDWYLKHTEHLESANPIVVVTAVTIAIIIY
jgi:hypothetical protein